MRHVAHDADDAGEAGSGGPVAELRLDVADSVRLWFGPGDPVRAASAIARLGDGWLIAQDDATHGGLWRAPGLVERVRLLPAVAGLEAFDEASGTKHLKPDLEAACEVVWGGRPAVLLLGSGSLPPRTHAALARRERDRVEVRVADLGPLYDQVRHALGLEPSELNLEGACVIGDALRWFQRGHPGSGVASASVDVDLRAIISAISGTTDPRSVEAHAVRRYDLGLLDGMGLTVTDAVALPDGRICICATAEDTPDPVDDGPIAGSALALLDDDEVVALTRLPERFRGCKIEGLGLVEADDEGARLIAVVDQDDPEVPSLAMRLRVAWHTPSHRPGDD